MAYEKTELYERREEPGCVDGILVARSLISQAFDHVNYYGGCDPEKSLRLLALLVCDVADDVRTIEGRSERYELPLSESGRRLDFKSMLQRLEAHSDNMSVSVQALEARANKKLGPAKANKSKKSSGG